MDKWLNTFNIRVPFSKCFAIQIVSPFKLFNLSSPYLYKFLRDVDFADDKKFRIFMVLFLKIKLSQLCIMVVIKKFQAFNIHR